MCALPQLPGPGAFSTEPLAACFGILNCSPDWPVVFCPCGHTGLSKGKVHICSFKECIPNTSVCYPTLHCWELWFGPWALRWVVYFCSSIFMRTEIAWIKKKKITIKSWAPKIGSPWWHNGIILYFCRTILYLLLVAEFLPSTWWLYYELSF